jgi:F-type H+-transporting ATPase subunit gamma
MKSIQDTMKITNAMYMISSTKLRKARTNLEETEPYFFTLQSMIARIIRHLPEVENELFSARTKKAPEDRIKGIIVVTADKGLAGAYNHNVLKLAEEMVQNNKYTRLFVVGEVGRQYFRSKNMEVAEQFHYTAQNPSLHRARVISELVIEQFKEEKLDEVHIVYTSMKNSMTTETECMQLLPFDRQDFEIEEAHKAGVFQKEIIFNPSPNAVLENILPDSVMGYVYGALVESFCSEQNARMMAMEAANKSASEMIHDLSIEYNRVRQAMITQEITEVISGAKAQKKKKKAK